MKKTINRYSLKTNIVRIFLITCFIQIFVFISYSQQPIFATIGGGDLYSFDLKNCTRHFIGSTNQGFGDIAFTPDGRLWGIVGGQLYQIDTTNANTILIGNTGIGSVTLVGLNDSILLAEFGEKLYGINNKNATSFYIGDIGFQANGDLTWYDDDLYMVTPLIKIVLNSKYDEIVSVTYISSSIPSCEGAVTASFVDDYNSIVGFNGSNLLKICQIDGTYKVLCPSLNIGGTPGAASIRLAKQARPPSCSMSYIQDISLNRNFSIYPNPTSDVINIFTNFQNPLSFSIYNLSGQLLKSGKINTNSSIQLDEFRSGFYTIELLADKEIYRKSFIVIK